MKLRQNLRHFAAKRALTTPVVGDVVRGKLVDLHTRVFLGKADPDHAEDRRAHLDAFFDATIDAYLAALDAGYTEAEAREITHIQANFDFFNHGWTEMMEFPGDEVEPHFERYADFFERHGVTVADPLGEFRTRPVPTAPSTPERLDRTDHPNAEGGFADDVYVDVGGEVVVGGREEPEEVDLAEAPGLGDDGPTAGN